jgi:T-complex protein 1 subunit gamma
MVYNAGCGLFEIRKIGDEYFTFLDECKDPKACTVLLRGGSKDVLNEIERNLMDAMNVVRNVLYDPRVVPGGGATEMAIATSITSKTMDATIAYPFKAVAGALEIIPKTLIENCGANTIRLLTDLRARHSTTDGAYFGIDGNKGVIADMRELKIFDSYLVKSQAIKTSIEAACMLLRIDDIVSGMSKKGGGGGGAAMAPEEAEDTVYLQPFNPPNHFIS